MPDDEKTSIWIIRGVIGFVGTTFVAVSLWLGTTVNDLAIKTERLTVVSESQTQTSQRLEQIIYETGQRLNKVHEEQLRRTVNVEKVTLLNERVDRLETRLKALESR
jgi:hypothetical protein